MIAGPHSLRYDPVGRLSIAAGTLYAYDGDSLTTERSNQAGNAIQRRYVHGPGVDEPLVWYEGSGTSDRRFLHADERGSVVAASDSAGNAVAINRYDEYGVPEAANAGRFQYTGQAWLPELGLYHYKARFYSSRLGRFLQTDPIGYEDGMNLYAYVGADPVNFVDPTGLNGCGASDEEEIQVCGKPDGNPGAYSNLPRRSVSQVQSARRARRVHQPTAARVQRKQKEESGLLPCLTAFGENFLGNLFDPLNTADGIVGIASGLAGAGIDAGLSGRAPPGGTVNMGGRTMKLARVGVGRSAIRTAGAAARGFAIGYVAISGGVAAYQASQDKRCQ